MADVKLNTQELITIYAALLAVSPSGGGSDTFALARGIATHIPAEELITDKVLALTEHYSMNVINEYKQSLEGN